MSRRCAKDTTTEGGVVAFKALSPRDRQQFGQLARLQHREIHDYAAHCLRIVSMGEAQDILEAAEFYARVDLSATPAARTAARPRSTIALPSRPSVAVRARKTQLALNHPADPFEVLPSTEEEGRPAKRPRQKRVEEGDRQLVCASEQTQNLDGQSALMDLQNAGREREQGPLKRKRATSSGGASVKEVGRMQKRTVKTNRSGEAQDIRIQSMPEAVLPFDAPNDRVHISASAGDGRHKEPEYRGQLASRSEHLTAPATIPNRESPADSASDTDSISSSDDESSSNGHSGSTNSSGRHETSRTGDDSGPVSDSNPDAHDDDSGADQNSRSDSGSSADDGSDADDDMEEVGVHPLAHREQAANAMLDAAVAEKPHVKQREAVHRRHSCHHPKSEGLPVSSTLAPDLISLGMTEDLPENATELTISTSHDRASDDPRFGLSVHGNESLGDTASPKLPVPVHRTRRLTSDPLIKLELVGSDAIQPLSAKKPPETERTLFRVDRAPNNPKKLYYGVRRGHKPGIYYQWAGADGAQVAYSGFRKRLQQSFKSAKDVEDYVNHLPGECDGRFSCKVDCVEAVKADVKAQKVIELTKVVVK